MHENLAYRCAPLEDATAHEGVVKESAESSVNDGYIAAEVRFMGMSAFTYNRISLTTLRVCVTGD
jgi:hypothetical protein